MGKDRKKITMFRAADYHSALFYILEKMGYEPQLGVAATDRTLSLGARYAPETLCLPHKYLLGTYIEALENKAEAIVIYNALAPRRKACRGGYIGDMQRQILIDMGYDFDFIVFPFGELVNIKLKEQGYSDLEIMEIMGTLIKKVLIYENIRDMLFKYRPLVKNMEMADRVYSRLVGKLEKLNNIGELNEFEKDIEESYKKIPADYDKDILKIAIIGELGCLNISFLSDSIYSLLGKLGVEITLTLKLTSYLMENPLIAEKALPYIGAYIGGDGQATVGYMIDTIETGHDGVIHLMPFTCLPETIARYAITEVVNDYNFPDLNLVLDEHTSKTGLVTRVEAYVDLLRARKEKKKRMHI